MNINAHKNDKAVAVWLLVIVALICAIILIGGATRLTNSGLSITQWLPVSGILPPTSPEEWNEAFRQYQQIPQYRIVNPDMTLEGFKTIYWWEWTHRAFGRFIGVAFFLPFVWFALRGYFSAAMLAKLALIFLLGAGQGALGWYMVASGLQNRIDVDPYRLALHLAMAFLLLGLCLHSALALLRPVPPIRWSRDRWVAGAILLALFVQILLGALVAGGRGESVPPALAQGIALPSPRLAAALLAAHQSLAYGIVAAVLLHTGLLVGKNAPKPAQTSRLLLTGALLVQVALGNFALFSAMPLATGLLHQAGAIVVFIVAVFHFHEARRDFPGDFP